MRQLGLFGGSATADEELPLFSRARKVSDALPSSVRFGTSSWTFPGWAGIVYAGRPSQRELVDTGLREYAKFPLFRTVGIDRSYYAPLTSRDLETYAAQLPADFRGAMKLWNAVTTACDPQTGERVPGFLDADLALVHIIEPILRSFADHIGPLMIELPPMRGPNRPSPREVAERLDRFLSRMPKELSFSVELRNADLLTPGYLSVLRRHGAGHVLNYWEAMPTIGRQLALPGILTSSTVVCRLLLPPGRKYEQQREAFAPFDRIAEADHVMRRDVCELLARAVAEKRQVYVLINNKAEGCSPLTALALAEQFVSRRGAAPSQDDLRIRLRAADHSQGTTYRTPPIKRSHSLSVGGGAGGALPLILLHSTSIFRPSAVSSVHKLGPVPTSGFSTMCPGGSGGRIEVGPWPGARSDDASPAPAQGIGSSVRVRLSISKQTLSPSARMSPLGKGFPVAQEIC